MSATRRRCERVFADYAPDAVVHFAALQGGRRIGAAAAGLLRQQPGRPAHRRARRCSAHGCRHIVFSSSATVYGMPERLPIGEDAPLSATNPYGQTKLMGETVLRDLRAQRSALEGRHAALLQPGGRARQRPDRRRPARHAEQPDALRGPGRRGPARRTCRSSATTTTPPTAPACATTSMSATWPRAMWRRCATCSMPARSLTVNLGTGPRLQRARGGRGLRAGQRPRGALRRGAASAGRRGRLLCRPGAGQRSCWAGAPGSASSACAPTAGAGSN